MYLGIYIHYSGGINSERKSTNGKTFDGLRRGYAVSRDVICYMWQKNSMVRILININVRNSIKQKCMSNNDL
jgi:hypothetical protein